MKILVTGTAGFIGFFLTGKLLQRGDEVVGLDNLNDYYDVQLKYSRLAECGIEPSAVAWKKQVRSKTFPQYRFIRMNLEDKESLLELCRNEKFDVVVNLAAQAGVRYSLIHPDAYVQSNVVGFLNILEACRENKTAHLVYASSSSVYGLNEQIPFSVAQNANHPVSLYAATKKANELMAHAYSHLYGIPTTGLRFFTVYGPWGRPDMAYYIFADAIRKGLPIRVFNHGQMKRDFTYVGDVVAAMLRIIDRPAKAADHWQGTNPDPASSSAPYRVYNIGNDSPVELIEFIKEIEKNFGRKAILEFTDAQPGDVIVTWADVDDLYNDFQFRPSTSIEEGIKRFASWYLDYYCSEVLTTLKGATVSV